MGGGDQARGNFALGRREEIFLDSAREREREREIDGCRERRRLRGTAEGKKRDFKEQIFCFQRKNKKEKEDTWLIFSFRSL